MFRLNARFRLPCAVLLTTATLELSMGPLPPPATAAEIVSAPVEFAQPGEISLMLQVSTVAASRASYAQLADRLEHIRRQHRDRENSGFVRNLVLTDIGSRDAATGSVALRAEVLDIIAPYLPGGPKAAFDLVFVGTLLEPACEQSCTPGWSAYVDGILDPQLRDRSVTDPVTLATAFRSRYPAVVNHWYQSWEGFLPDLMRDVIYDRAGNITRTKVETDAIRAAYLDYQTRLFHELRAVADGFILWSPAVQQRLEQVDVDHQREAVARNVRDHFTQLAGPSGQNRMWLAIQDTLGRCWLAAGNTTESTIAWRKLIAQNYTFANLSINAETFLQTGGIPACGTWTSLAARERARARLLDYAARGETIGPSFDLDRWYESVHRMPWPNP
jgi:hypothetical protein